MLRSPLSWNDVGLVDDDDGGVAGGWWRSSPGKPRRRSIVVGASRETRIGPVASIRTAVSGEIRTRIVLVVTEKLVLAGM